MNVLIVYYPVGEIRKVVSKLEELFVGKKINCTVFEAVSDKEFDIKKQFKLEKKLILSKKIPCLRKFDLILIGTPIISFTSVPTINVFIRNMPVFKNKKIVLFATGIGLPGNAVKKMTYLLSMKNYVVVDSQVFSSIFEFDSKKMLEVENFFKRFSEKLSF